MTESDIFNALNLIFRDIFDDDNIVLNAETTADDIPEWDSISHINIIVSIEARFKIKFLSAEIEKMKNVGELVSAIQRKTSKP